MLYLLYKKDFSLSFDHIMRYGLDRALPCVSLSRASAEALLGYAQAGRNDK